MNSGYQNMKCLLPVLTLFTIVSGCLCGNRQALANHPVHNKAYNKSATALLVRGINEDNDALIMEAVNHGADVNALGSIGGPAKRGLTALIIVASNGDTSAVEQLLSKGAWVNYRGNLGFTALILAGNHKGNADVARLLLDSGAKINTKNDLGQTAIWWAASNGKADIVRLLIERHANVNIRSDIDCSTLMIAGDAHPEIKQMLRAAGARYSPTDINNYRAAGQH